MKLVRETAAGKSISAYVILNRKGEQVATVQAHFANSGAVTVDVWNDGGDAAAERIARAMGYEIDSEGRIASGAGKGQWAYVIANHQQGRATGYGYDKFAAALAGLIIDGHRMTDHCGGGKALPKGRTVWPKDAKAPRGYTFANYRSHGVDEKGVRIELPPEQRGYCSCFRRAGFDYLQAFGYRILKAI